ncbi:DUF881 domain-containing protein [Agilicoccus flavus]|uniref:DUF881 domain-containing protein n=1 Tax=Agilicoccus flavus TaxID=2775968 RepID=UPI001CF6DFF1|nr:DUF881 domain-containing protein [Agilicoccus flavus]
MSRSRSHAPVPVGLLEALAEPLDPGYEAVHRVRSTAHAARAGSSSKAPGESKASGESGEGPRPDEAGAVRPRPRPGHVAGSLAVGLVIGLVLATSGLASDRTRSSLRERRAALVERVEASQADVDALTARASALRGAGPTAADSRSADARLAEAAGAVPLTGPGLVVTLDDAPAALAPAPAPDAPGAGDAAESGRIVARDVAQVANELWAAGATGVAVNGQRLTATSSIRFAGRAILVGYRPLARPYEIGAVGPADLAARFEPRGGVYLDELRTAFGARVGTAAVARLTLPAGTLLDLDHAAPAPGAVDGPEQWPRAPASPATPPAPSPGETSPSRARSTPVPTPKGSAS